ncbi:MAG: hypothetical protein ACRDZO_12855 [Egibacteraceae bacterium]
MATVSTPSANAVHRPDGRRLARQPVPRGAGPSGSGKSSLVRAGVIPTLKGDDFPGSKTWTHPADHSRGAPLKRAGCPARPSLPRRVDAADPRRRCASG